VKKIRFDHRERSRLQLAAIHTDDFMGPHRFQREADS
jgi:hypothetical protein